MHSLLLVDWVALLVMAGSVLIGLWRGLIYEAVLLGGWVAAVLGAGALWPWVVVALPLDGLSDGVQQAIGMALALIVIVFAANLLAWRLRRAARAAGVRPADSALGGCFGALRGLAVLTLAMLVVQHTPLQHTGWAQAPSLTRHWLMPLALHVQPWLPDLPRWPDLPGLPAASGAALPW